MRDETKIRLILSFYVLNQYATYTKETIIFEGDFPCDVELPLCAYEDPRGGFEITTEEVPEPPELEGDPEPVRVSVSETFQVTARPLVITPRLPENPTAQERWRYLLAVLKDKGRV